MNKCNDTLLVRKVDPAAKLPVKNHSTDLGYDLFALEDVEIMPDTPTLIRTGIAVKFPEGWGGFIEDRSSIALKRNIEKLSGVIDGDYTGEIKIIMLYNQQQYDDKIIPNKILKGEKIAQLVPIPITNWEISEVEQLPETNRGDKGFGSSGQ